MERIGGPACEGRTSAPLSMSAGSAVRAASLAYSPGSWHLDGPARITVAVCLGLAMGVVSQKGHADPLHILFEDP